MFKNKYLILTALFLVFGVSFVYAEEPLPDEKSNIMLESVVSEDNLETESEKIKHSTNLPIFLDTVKNGLELESGLIKKIKVGVQYDAAMNFIDSDSNFNSVYKISAIDLYMHTYFRDDKTSLRLMYNPARQLSGYTNYFSRGISELQIVRNLNANQKILIGQGATLPIGIEGSLPFINLDMVERAQIGRTFSNVRSVGIRNIASYKYLDYDIGVYDATRYFQDFFEGTELTLWANTKPLAKFNDKYGKLKAGSGCSVGNYHHSYSVFGTYLGYDYKKIHTKFEYAYADGYNGVVNSSNKAEGLYGTIAYDITPKLQLLGRYDYFNPNKAVYKDSAAEYGAGLTYSFDKNFKILVNYVYKNYDSKPSANAIMIATRINL